jgi:serine/threonine protein kinase
MRLAIDAQLGPYRVAEFLGAGGMGEVYRARDTRLGRDVALKILSPEAAADAVQRGRFEQEARAAALMNHPNIVAIYDVGEHDGIHYIVSELVHGKTLSALIRERVFTTMQTLDAAIQIADALATAHAAGIIHRDLKPGNIMLTSESRVKVLDFGLAKIASAPPSTEGPTKVHTRTGFAVGTLVYMSPEQVRGEPVDAGTDIWSLGVTIFQMMTGEIPFGEKTEADTLVSIVSRPPEDLTTFCPLAPPELSALIKRALEKDRHKRYRTSREMLGELTALKQSLEQSLTQPTQVHQTIRKPVRRIGLLTGIMLAVVALLAATAWRISSGREVETAMPAKPARALRYLFVIQKMNSGRADGPPIETANPQTLQAGWKFRLRFTPAAEGSLYLFSESEARGKSLQLLFPLPSINAGSSRLAPPTMETGWYVVDNEPGRETLWMLWSPNPLEVVEEIVHRAVNERARGLVDGLADLQSLQAYLSGTVSSGTQSAAGIDIDGAGVVVHSTTLVHR